FILFEDFNIIIQEPDKTQPYGSYDHEHGIDIQHPCKKQRGYQYGSDDDQPAHSRCSFFQGFSFEPQVTHGFTDLLPLEKSDKALAEQHGYDQRQDHGHRCAEGDVIKYPRSEQSEVLTQICKEVIEHRVICLKV